MKAVLEDAVFRSPGSNLDLLAYFRLALEGKHRIEVDKDAPHFNSWLDRRGRDDREECMFVLDSNLKEESSEPSRFIIHVDDVAVSNWRSPTPTVTVKEGLHVLHEPFVVLLEDEESDKHFLLRMATAEQREWLRAMERNGALEFGHGGGLPNMKRRVTSDKKTKPYARLRMWVLFDSDALSPDMPSVQSTNLKKACGKIIEHHQLRRRTIENYLPRRALSLHAHERTGDTAKSVSKVDALFRLSSSQRNHYNMKEGFHGDRKRNPDAGDLYSDVSAGDRELLHHGFGDQLAKLFAGDSITETMLKKDGGWDEVNGAVTNLIALIR